MGVWPISVHSVPGISGVSGVVGVVGVCVSLSLPEEGLVFEGGVITIPSPPLVQDSSKSGKASKTVVNSRFMVVTA